MIPYAEFVRRHAGLSRERFLERVPHPYLLFFLADSKTDPGETPFLTRKFDMNEPSSESRAFLQAVAKNEKANAFGLMITLGRANNNDLMVRHPSVSKFHCYFRRLGESWTVSDANSLNGTTLEGQRIAPETPFPLRSGQVLQLAGVVVAEFLDPAELYERLALEDALGSTERAALDAAEAAETARIPWHNQARDEGDTPNPEDTLPLNFRG